ncbi:unnamed protein product [Ilex paraguariensis]|uniref:Uncharacterized protein n=2 Tax=Ilex paraguariensis TaxID=185542 RepID=A0ABC8RT10_9AQUA
MPSVAQSIGASRQNSPNAGRLKLGGSCLEVGMIVLSEAIKFAYQQGVNEAVFEGQTIKIFKLLKEDCDLAVASSSLFARSVPSSCRIFLAYRKVQIGPFFDSRQI